MVYRQQRLSPEEGQAARRKRVIRTVVIIGLVCGTLLAGLVIVVGVGLIFLSSKSSDNTALPAPEHRPQPVLPEFPWPPRSSAYTKIPSQYLVKSQGQTFLRDVSARLESAYRSGGYGQTGYYSVPGGFALVSALEQFKPNGLPASDPYRWSERFETQPIFSLNYFNDLIKGRVGRYRVVVFVVSNDFFSQDSGKRVDIAQARSIALEGANILPGELGDLLYTDAYTCTALIYEFQQTPGAPAKFHENSELLAEIHLQKILPYLQR